MEKNHFSKILFCFIMLIYLSITHSAFSLPSSSLRQVKFTNNTATHNLIATELLTNDSEYKTDHDWHGLQSPIVPYATQTIITLNADHLKENKYYHFKIHIMDSQKAPIVDIIVDAKKKLLLQTELNLSFNAGDDDQAVNFNQDNLAHYQLSGNSNANAVKAYTLHFSRYLPANHIHRDYHIVLDKVKSSTPNTDNPKQLNILTYNTMLMPFYVNVVENLNHSHVRVNSIPDKITQYDVVIVEELFARRLRNKMILLMSNHYPYHSRVVGYNTKKILTGGVMIFSKWPILAENQIIYHAGTDYDMLAAKGAVYVKIIKRNQIYHIIGTHLQSGNAGPRTGERDKQITELQQFINTLNIPREEPLLLGGDFNVNEFSPELPLLLNTTNTYAPPNTGHLIFSCDANINTMMSNSSRVRLDYILASKDHLPPLKSNNHIEILREFYQKKMWPHFDLSDHFAVAGEFIYP